MEYSFIGNPMNLASSRSSLSIQERAVKVREIGGGVGVGMEGEMQDDLPVSLCVRTALPESSWDSK